MDTVRTLLLRTVSDGGPQPNDRRPLFLLAGLSDCVIDSSEIATNPQLWSATASGRHTGHRHPHGGLANRRLKIGPQRFQ